MRRDGMPHEVWKRDERVHFLHQKRSHIFSLHHESVVKFHSMHQRVGETRTKGSNLHCGKYVALELRKPVNIIISFSRVVSDQRDKTDKAQATRTNYRFSSCPQS